MNAPSLSTTFTVEGITPASLGLELFEIAQRREVALSDARGCADMLRFTHPGLTRSEWRAARRIAIDLQGQATRNPDARLAAACRAALTQAEKVAEGSTGDDAHSALAKICDLLAKALMTSGSDAPQRSKPREKGPGQPRADGWPEDAFAIFKAAYPRKVSWGSAEKALHRIRKRGGVSFDRILAGAIRLADEHREERFTPYPATWLNARGWEDAIPASQNSASLLEILPRHQIEGGLLGAILVNNDSYDRVSDFLRPEHFAEEINRRIFEVTSSLIKVGRIATPITLRDTLGEHDIGDGVQLSHYLAHLAATSMLGIDARSLGRELRRAHNRDMRKAGESTSPVNPTN